MASIPVDVKQSPPWEGPPFTPVQAVKPTRSEKHPAEYPFTDPATGPQGLFPPVCLRSHWDPEKIIRRTLPIAGLSMPLEPRPWTKICMEYTTTQDFEEAPRPRDGMVMPGGGVNYPPSRFRESIDNESLLRRLDRPLGTCEEDQYIVPRSGNMYRPGVTLPDRIQPNSRFIEELSFPQACMRGENYKCRQDTNDADAARSSKPFNNATKQERYITRPDLNSRGIQKQKQAHPQDRQN